MCCFLRVNCAGEAERTRGGAVVRLMEAVRVLVGLRKGGSHGEGRTYVGGGGHLRASESYGDKQES